MAFLDNLAMGFGIALTPENFIYCFIGATIGTLVGVLPGLSPVTTIAMLLPITFKMPAVASLIMLSGIYYGAHHAASTTSIMLNMPGEPSAVVICLDGYPMAQKGRAGPALCISAIGSFFAGCVAVLVLALFSPPLAKAALAFGTPEYAATIILALVVTAALSGKSLFVTIAMAALGLLFGTVGIDLNTSVMRFTFGFIELQNGIDLTVMAVAFFALAEIASRLTSPELRDAVVPRVTGLLPRLPDLKASWAPILRGTTLGGAIGVLPGTGAILASFVSYAVERWVSKTPERFGHGAIEGVAGPESAANAAALTHFIPMLTLGIPAGATMALMMGALMIQGITPGPQVMTEHPQLFWGLIASMLIGNLMLLILNLPLVGVWVRLLRTPYRLMFPTILAFCCLAVYETNSSPFDVMLAALFGGLGFILNRLDVDPSPMILGLVMGPMLEENLRRTLILSHGDPAIFFTRPISLALLVFAAVLVVVLTMPSLFTSRIRTAHSASSLGAQKKD